MTKNNFIEQTASDAITQKPLTLKITTKEITQCSETFFYIFKRNVNRVKDVTKTFLIYPPTLGKMQILSKLYLQLGINEEVLKEEPHSEAMRVSESNTDTVCQIMAVATLCTKDELQNEDEITRRTDFFKWNCYPQDFATCLLAILTQIDYANFMTSIRLTKMFRQNKPNNQGAVRVEQLGVAPSGVAY